MPSGKFSFWETKASTDDRPIGPLGAASKPKSGSRSGRSKPEPETSTGRQSLKARSQSKTGRKERTKSQHRTDSGLSKRSASKPRPPLPRIAVPPQQITQIQQETNSVVSNDSEKTDPMSLLHGTATNREIQSKRLLEWIAQLLLTLLKSEAFSIHSLLYGKVKKCTRLHFYPGDHQYFKNTIFSIFQLFSIY